MSDLETLATGSSGLPHEVESATRHAIAPIEKNSDIICWWRAVEPCLPRPLDLRLIVESVISILVRLLYLSSGKLRRRKVRRRHTGDLPIREPPDVWFDRVADIHF